MRKKITQLSIFMMNIIMLLSLFMPSVLAATSSEQNVNNIPGTEGYLPLGRHMVPTSIPNVYKVTDWLDAPKVEIVTTEIIKHERAPVYVAIILDASGSMDITDIYDATTSTLISRYKALEYAVAAALQALIDDGNKNVYVNISTHDGNNPISTVTIGIQDVGATVSGTRTGMPTSLDALTPAGQYFISLYDSSGNIRPLLDPANINTPAFVMTDWALGDNVFPPPIQISPTGWSFWFNMNDFAVPFKRISGFFKEELVNGTIPENSSRYILAMGDGDDRGATSQMISPSSAAWATSLKAPLDSNFKNGGSLTANKVIFNADGGIGATIWGVTVGDETPHIANDYTAILQPSSTWTTSYWPSYHGEFEPRMIGNTWDIPANMQNNLPIIPSSIADYSNQVIDLYSGWYTADGVTNAKSSTHYAFSNYLTTPDPLTTLVSGNEPLENFFKDFGTSAAESAEIIKHKSTIETSGTNVTIIDRLNTDAFSYYQWPNEPMITFSTTDPAAISTPSDIQYTANIEGNNQIRWTLKKFNAGYRYMISYYVICNKPLSENYYYPVSTDAFVTYTDQNSIAVKKQFPGLYLNGAEYQNQSANTTNGTIGSVMTSAGIGQSPTIGLDGIPIFTGSNSTSGNGTSGSGSGNSSSGSSSFSLSSAATPYQASVPNKNTTKKASTNKTQTTGTNQGNCTAEQIDKIATKKMRGNILVMNTSKVPVYELPCKDAKVVLYLAKGKQFKIAGVTENYYMIQYKKKDGKTYKGYVLKKDVKLLSQK